MWKRPQHDTDITETVAPSPPVFVKPNRVSAADKLCLQHSSII